MKECEHRLSGKSTSCADIVAVVMGQWFFLRQSGNALNELLIDVGCVDLDARWRERHNGLGNCPRTAGVVVDDVAWHKGWNQVE